MAESVLDGAVIDWQAEAEQGVVDPRALKTMQDLERFVVGVRQSLPPIVPRAALGGLATTGASEPALFYWAGLRMLECVSCGVESEVYRAYDPALDRVVAVKLWTKNATPAEIRRASIEAQRQAQVLNQHVAAVYGVPHDAGRTGIVMEYIRGQTLQALVQERDVLSARETVGIGLDLCDALIAIHAAGISHGDIKPANVMRAAGGRIVLLDLGCARAFQGERVEGDSDVSGTPLTTAPEVLLERAEPHPTQDVYAAGVLLYWLLTGRYPVEANNYEALVRAHQGAVSRPALSDVRPGLPAPITVLVDRALRRAPQERPQTVGELRTQLALVQMDDRVPVGPTPGILRRWGRLCACLAVLPLGLGPGQVHSQSQHVRLYRAGAQRSEVLRDGSTVHWGDAIQVDVTLDTPMHVWMINEDDRGNAYLLYPEMPDASPILEPGRVYRLTEDPSGADAALSISDDARVETILVVASVREIPELTTILQGLPRPGEQPSGARGFGQRVSAPSRTGGTIAQVLCLPALRRGSQDTWRESLVLVHASTP